MSVRGLLVLFFLAVVPTTQSQTIQPSFEPQELEATTPVQQRKLTIEETLSQAKQSLYVDDDTLLNLHKRDQELFCMAQATFFEAKSESFTGKVAVSEVVQNRVKSGKFPSDACKVVRQATLVKSQESDNSPRVITKVCQFNWACKTNSSIPLRDSVGKLRPEILSQWRDSVLAAMIVYQNKVSDVVNGATHFYSRSDNAPHWRAMVKTKKIGNHTFMRERE